jgi:hypothetical protein
MYRRALKCAAVGAFAAAVLISSSQAFAAEGSFSPVSSKPVSLEPTRAMPEGVKISLHFLTDAVAAGAFPTVAHQAEFEVRAVDSKGKPRSGVEIDLPVVISGGKGPTESLFARVTWGPASARAGHATAITGTDGVARGTFTAGSRGDEAVVLQVPRTEARAEINQVWKDCGTFEDSQEDALVRVRYNFRLSRDGVGPDGKPARVSIPITGHSMKVELTNLTIGFTNQELGPDENEDGKPDGEYQEKKVSSDDVDLTEWKGLQQYVEIGKVTEVEPGIYQGIIRFNPPKTVDREEGFAITDWRYSIVDESAFELHGDDTTPGK